MPKAILQQSLGITLLSLVMLCSALPSASAEEGELSLSAGVTAARWADPRDGASNLDSGLTLGAAWWFTDFWSGAVRLRGAAVVTGDDAPAPVLGADIEARYVLDALTWVPWASPALAWARPGLVRARPLLIKQYSFEF